MNSSGIHSARQKQSKQVSRNTKFLFSPGDDLTTSGDLGKSIDSPYKEPNYILIREQMRSQDYN